MDTKELEIRPKLFIGSSVEGLKVAYAIQENIEHQAEVTVWDQDVFKLSRNTLEELIRLIDLFDFAVFVFGSDDIKIIRGNKISTPRDNVIFELGLFIGTLGINRTFFVLPRDNVKIHLPTDLAGIHSGDYDAARSDGNLKAALGPFCNKLRNVIDVFGRRPKIEISGSALGLMPEFDQAAAICFKIIENKIYVLLVKTTSERWVIPKTALIKGESINRAILRCAYHEGGVGGGAFQIVA